MAGRIKDLKQMEAVRHALDFLKEDDEQTLKEQLEMCQIPAPSGMEQEKAAYVLKKMEEIGLTDVHIDEVGNVLGKICGTGNGPRIMLAAHTDTVFPPETDLSIKRDGNRYICPGINDDTRAVAEMLSIARAMKKFGLKGTGTLVFCANVCEEGLGDLKGVKHLFREPNAYDGFVSIDDGATGGIIYMAAGSERYHVTFCGPGGHSFSAFGTPNPIHAMGRAIGAIADFQVPKEPKTTFSVGIVEGGTSVNTISSRCSMLMDLRSTDAKELEKLCTRFKETVLQAAEAENARWNVKNPETEGITVTFEQVGKRPAGVQPRDSEIVQAAIEACKAVGIEPSLRVPASTDANIPISLGIPAITVGRGGLEDGTHTVCEWFEPVEAYKGPQRDLLLMLELIGYGL